MSHSSSQKLVPLEPLQALEIRLRPSHSLKPACDILGIVCFSFLAMQVEGLHLRP